MPWFLPNKQSESESERPRLLVPPPEVPQLAVAVEREDVDAVAERRCEAAERFRADRERRLADRR